jgi:hypothetical protein
MITSSTQNVKNGALLTKSAHRPANLSKKPRLASSRVCATPLPSLLKPSPMDLRRLDEI